MKPITNTNTLQSAKARRQVRSGVTQRVVVGGRARTAVACSLALLLAAGAQTSIAQNTAQDAINRSLLQRQQQAQEFQNRLQRGAGNVAQPPASAAGSLAAPQLPGPSLDLPPGPPAPASSPAASDLQFQQLFQSQQQRQLGQQTQNRFLPAPMREQQDQIQLLQFQREDQAQRLEKEIQSSAARAMRPFD